MEQYKEKRMRIKIKNTKDEFKARIGFYQVLLLTGHQPYRISIVNFEIKKEQINETKYEAKVLVIHAILSQREAVDRMMRDFIIGDRMQG